MLNIYETLKKGDAVWEENTYDVVENQKGWDFAKVSHQNGFDLDTVFEMFNCQEKKQAWIDGYCSYQWEKVQSKIRKEK